MFSLGEYEGIVVRWSLVVQYMSVSSIIYSVLPRRVRRDSGEVEFSDTVYVC